MKIDVEGAEVKVLEGASGLLSRDDAPSILLEINPAALALLGTSESRLAILLQDHGYSLQPVADHGEYRNMFATKQPSAVRRGSILAK